ncbi:MAG: GTP-binding protein [Armatimonadetes bacterium]|nr:GTP-binding protein [Armatimonadota bacterium]
MNDLHPIPVILLTGYLGAGKTTLANRILDYWLAGSLRPAMVINEFGSVSIDARLLDAGREPLFEINRGSLFCTCTQDTMVKVMVQMAGYRPPRDTVLMEATGVADTATLAGTLSIGPIRGRFRVAQNICLVDAYLFPKVCETLPVVPRQIEQASAVLLNKTDLVEPEALAAVEETVRRLNPSLPIIETRYADIDPAHLLALSDGWKSGKAQASAPPIFAMQVTLETEGVLDRPRLAAFLDSQVSGLLRGKGPVSLREGVYLVEWVRQGWMRMPKPGLAEDRNRLVLVGSRRSAGELQERLDACQEKS